VSDGERKTLAAIGKRSRKQALAEVASLVTPATILSPGQSLIHDRDETYCPAFQERIDAAGIKRVPQPPWSPNLNAYAERWVRSVKEEYLSWLLLCGEATLRRVLHEYVEHYHHERNHQARATCGAVLRSAKTQGVKAPCSVVHGWAGC